MNLKKTLLSFMAAGAVLAGGIGGATAQSAVTGTTTGTVKVGDGGTFDVYFCSATLADGGVAFDDASVTSSEGAEVTGDGVICYIDDTTYRGRHSTMLSASNFVGDEHAGVISNGNLSLGHVSIMNSGQWAGDVPGVGSIAALTSSGSVSSHAGADFGPNDLSGQVHIHNVWPGAGTAGDFYETFPDPTNPDSYFPRDDRSNQGSWQEVEFVLEVPAGTRADDYKTTLTLNVNPGTP